MSIAEILAGRPQPRREPPRERRTGLRVVPDPRPVERRPSRTPFVVLVLGVLGFGFVGLLLLNTSLQQGSFAMQDLEGTTKRLQERQGVLEQRVAAMQAPENLARRAKKMGMVPNPNPAFLRMRDGRVLGRAEPAKAPPPPAATSAEKAAKRAAETGSLGTLDMNVEATENGGP